MFGHALKGQSPDICCIYYQGNVDNILIWGSGYIYCSFVKGPQRGAVVKQARQWMKGGGVLLWTTHWILEINHNVVIISVLKHMLTPPDNPAGRWCNALVFCVNTMSSSLLSVCVCPTLGQRHTQTKRPEEINRDSKVSVSLCVCSYHCYWLGVIHHCPKVDAQ